MKLTKYLALFIFFITLFFLYITRQDIEVQKATQPKASGEILNTKVEYNIPNGKKKDIDSDNEEYLPIDSAQIYEIDETQKHTSNDNAKLKGINKKKAEFYIQHVKENSALIEYRKREKCYNYFYLKNEQQISNFLSDQANTNSILATSDLEGITNAMLERANSCHTLVGDSTESQFLDASLEILHNLAEKDNSEAQYLLGTIYEQKSMSVLNSSEETLFFQEQALLWLEKSSYLNNPQAKVALALEYLDYAYKPHLYDIEEAQKLINEATNLTGNEYENLRKLLNNL